MNTSNVFAYESRLAPRGASAILSTVNGEVLRRSYATWLVEAGAVPKAVQGQMRRPRIGPTMDIYAQIVAAAQRRAVAKLSEMLAGNVSNWDEMGRKGRPENSQVIENMVELVGIEPTTSSLRTMRSPS